MNNIHVVYQQPPGNSCSNQHSNHLPKNVLEKCSETQQGFQILFCMGRTDIVLVISGLRGNFCTHLRGAVRRYICQFFSVKLQGLLEEGEAKTFASFPAICCIMDKQRPTTVCIFCQKLFPRDFFKCGNFC